MTGPGSQRRARAAKQAAIALHRAVGTVRQHPNAAALQHAALRRCLAAVQVATQDAPLGLDLSGDTVVVAGDPVAAIATTSGPLGALRRAGIGALELAPGIPPAAVAELVARLANLQAEADPEDAYRRIAAPGLSHVRLRAAAAGAAALAQGVAGWTLPDRSHDASHLRPLVARDLACNLPARAARQLFEDLEEQPLAGDDALVGLFARLLADADYATAGWMLGEAAHHPQVPNTAHQRLVAAATARVDDGWLQQQLEQGSGEELLTLASFLMELGDDVAERLARVAADSAQPWSRLLCDLLGRRG